MIHPPNTARRPSENPNASIDWWLAGIVMILLCLGLLMVFSASGAVAEANPAYHDRYWFFKHQCIYALLGGFVAVLVANVPRRYMYLCQFPFLLLVIIMLILVLTPLGIKVKGAVRWISIAGLSIQPLEFAKVALALYLAHFMTVKQDSVRHFLKGFLPPIIVTMVLCVLLYLQPDFGGALTLLALLLAMCIIGGTRFLYIAAVTIIGCGVAYAITLNTPYRLRRLTAFLDPEQDALGSGYQLLQSFYAFGSGGFWGVGLGGGAQKMLYLPEAHTDFIMSVVGEELGFFGVSVIMLLFIVLFIRCYRIIIRQPELRDRFSAFAVTLVLYLGAIQNLAVVLGMMPPKGVAMPFLSYGGSCMLSSMLCIGLLLNFSKTARQ